MKNKWLIILLVCVCFITLTGCNSSKEETTSISKSELETVMESGKYTIVDVRNKDEYGDGHVKGAINIPVDEIDDKVDLDKNNTIIVYCKSGVRSNKAAIALRELGYKVIDLGAYSNIKLEKE